MPADYSIITELPHSKVLPIQVERSLSRYLFGAKFCADKRVLEIACGGGQGLGLLAKNAKFVMGADYESKNLAHASKSYQDRTNISLIQLDAHKLPFKRESFDVILIYEAIYYLERPDEFLNECHRVLSPEGQLIICTANKNWADFNPSPYSHKYYSVPELNSMLQRHKFLTEFFAAFPTHQSTTFKSRLISFLKRAAVRLHLMPKTMKGKVLLKRLFLGGLKQMPSELTESSAPYTPPISIPSDQNNSIHTAIYAVAQKK